MIVKLHGHVELSQYGYWTYSSLSIFWDQEI